MRSNLHSRYQDIQPNRKRHTLLVMLLAICCATAFYHVYQANTQLTPILPPLAAQDHLQRWLNQDFNQLEQREPLHHPDTVAKIYQRTGYKQLWLKDYQLADTGKLLMQHLRETSADQRLDYQYHLTYVQHRLYNLPSLPRDATALDILLTDAFVSYADDVFSDKLFADTNIHRQGLRPVAYSPYDETNHQVDHNNIVSLLEDNASPWKLTKVLTNMSPENEEYLRLRQALIDYQQLSQNIEWRPLPKGPNLKQAQRHPQVRHLRKLLSLYGDYPLPSDSLIDWFAPDPAEPEDPLLFDAELAASLGHFQDRHGSEATGKLDKTTRAQLNVSPAYRVKQIALNMKRWRQLPRNLGERYIWVNLMDFQLQLVNKGHTELAMKVIVGKTYRQTPSLQESVSTLVLNPVWNIPRKITLYDILPKARKDPSYLSDRKIHVLESWSNPVEVPLETIDWANATPRNFPYRMQQEAGNFNALGSVKFVLPNDKSIYLHDTSQPELFSRHKRALSSGCIRLEKPMALARALLENKRGWNDHRINTELALGETRYVKLPKSVPTYLTYWTSWVNKHGIVQFRDDIYKRDQIPQGQSKELEKLIL